METKVWIYRTDVGYEVDISRTSTGIFIPADNLPYLAKLLKEEAEVYGKSIAINFRPQWEVMISGGSGLLSRPPFEPLSKAEITIFLRTFR